jgi:hypothetical protein
MTDITIYSDEELSLIFLNEEYYYNELMRAVRHGSFGDLFNLIEGYFYYNPEQLVDLEETFNNELAEYNENE